MPTSIVGQQVLEAALLGFQIRLAQIESKIAEVRQRLGNGTNTSPFPAATPEKPRRKRPVLSAKRITNAAMAQNNRRSARTEAKTERTAKGRPAAPQSNRIQPKAVAKQPVRSKRLKKAEQGIAMNLAEQATVPVPTPVAERVLEATRNVGILATAPVPAPAPTPIVAAGE